MFYPGTEMYKLALDKNIIGSNYIEEVLFRRMAMRKSKEINAEWLATYAFNNTSWLPSKAILKLLSNLSVYKLLNSNIFKKLFYLLFISLGKFRDIIFGVPVPSAWWSAPPSRQKKPSQHA
jgi:hypothetical protein